MNSTRGRIRDPREDILLETNFDEDGALTRAYNQSQNGSSIHQMNRRRPSDHSLDRYSDNTMHGRPKSGNCCKSCITRIPYATMIATVMCFIGVVVFCGTMYRGSSLVIIMLDRVFNLRFLWIEALQMIFIIIGATMGALGLMILFVGFLATGDTRYKVYRAWRARVGGRISCAVCMGITYILNILWILTLCFLAIITFVFTVFWNMCSSPDVQSHKAPIDLTQFYFFFPDDVRQERLKIQDELEVKAFCKDCVETAEVMFILASVACLLIILSLVHYLICLSANYAHIRDHEKFQELQEIKNLNEMEYAASKERF